MESQFYFHFPINMNTGLVWNSQELASQFWPLGPTADDADDNQPVQKGKSFRNFSIGGDDERKGTQRMMENYL